MKQATADAVMALQTLNEDGELMVYAEDVVEAARDKKSPLHSEFEWDDTEAAQQYRLAQARNLIARVTVLLEPDADSREVIKVRGLLALRADRRGYRSTQSIANSPPLRAALLQQLAGDLARVRVKYQTLESVLKLPALFKALDTIIKTVQRASRRRGKGERRTGA